MVPSRGWLKKAILTIGMILVAIWLAFLLRALVPLL